ncbi:hypothetical protein P170DRAFT_357004 [Aspergillus steynii IBT 23096]|uniref:Protein kinase domain-containing protein n=1 Tax=Aspergillus steynii IBT 23096 TaxID=1392250 RepID=A0A2I2G8G6_9EURO|nr:uncharacterized protein P170DRAFT_357004 [Aspergillus steynii IBT 23096]PLB49171.1 hypothetical protein P170DRAFT_357004 [Aspergillus steynii IBT 23096]
MPIPCEVKLSDITFLEKLKESKYSAIFKVSIHGLLRVMKVYHNLDLCPPEWAPPDREVDLFVCESTAYQRLHDKGLCKRGLILDFYGTITNIQPLLCQPSLGMFLEDKRPPNAVLIEYIPNMRMIDLSNFSERRVSELRRILLEDIHPAGVLHGDPMPRNMMVQDKDGRVLWIDFDSAQTFTEDGFLTPRQEWWVKEEVEMVDYFVDALARDCEDGKIDRTRSYYYEWFG